MKQTSLYKYLFRNQHHKLWTISLWSLIAVTVLYMSFRITDTDLYYILPTGRYILTHGIPYKNPFITTPGQNIVVQNWLYCTIVAFMYNHFHAFGLWIIQMLTLMAFTAVIFEFFDAKHSQNKLLIGIFTLIAFFMFGYTNIRPEMLTFVLIMLEIIGIEKSKKPNGSLWLLLIPITTLLEINVHASYWIMHMIVLLPYGIKGLPKTQDSHVPIKKMIVPTIIAIGTLTINPYGIYTISYVFDALKSHAVSLADIGEQQPFTINSVHVWLYIGFMLLFVSYWKEKKLTSTDAYMYIGFSILFICAIKWTAFYTIAMLFLLRAVFKQTERTDNYNIAKLQVPGICPILILCLTIILIHGIVVSDTTTKVLDTKTDNYLDNPKDTLFTNLDELADWLDDNDPNASVFAIFQEENYFEYRGYKVYYDARPELYASNITHDKNIMQNVLKAYYGNDVLGYHNDKKTNKKPYEYALTPTDFSDLMYNDIATDYYVINVTRNTLYQYFESNPDLYECVLTSNEYKLYKRKVLP